MKCANNHGNLPLYGTQRLDALKLAAFDLSTDRTTRLAAVRGNMIMFYVCVNSLHFGCGQDMILYAQMTSTR